MIYELDDYYFLMEPRQAVLSHFPREPDADWQLLTAEQRASLASFEGWPLVKSQFFKCGMDLLNETSGTIQAKQGISCPTFVYCTSTSKIHTSTRSFTSIILTSTALF